MMNVDVGQISIISTFFFRFFGFWFSADEERSHIKTREKTENTRGEKSGGKSCEKLGGKPGNFVDENAPYPTE